MPMSTGRGGGRRTRGSVARARAASYVRRAVPLTQRRWRPRGHSGMSTHIFNQMYHNRNFMARNPRYITHRAARAA